METTLLTLTILSSILITAVYAARHYTNISRANLSHITHIRPVNTYVISTTLILAAAPMPVSCVIPNAAFGGTENQVSVHLGQSLYGGHMENLFIIGLQYSQPNHFFRIPGRRSVELITVRGINGLSRYNQLAVFGFAQDAVFPLPCPIYAGINLGIYIKSEATDRVGSTFTFGERVFTGVKIFESMAMELYARHFSNGSLTEKNNGQNFVGLSVMKNF